MKELTLHICKEILGKSYLDSYVGRNEVFIKIIVECACLSPDMVRKLSVYENYYICAFDNFPSIVIRCKHD